MELLTCKQERKWVVNGIASYNVLVVFVQPDTFPTIAWKWGERFSLTCDSCRRVSVFFFFKHIRTTTTRLGRFFSLLVVSLFSWVCMLISLFSLRSRANGRVPTGHYPECGLQTASPRNPNLLLFRLYSSLFVPILFKPFCLYVYTVFPCTRSPITTAESTARNNKFNPTLGIFNSLARFLYRVWPFVELVSVRVVLAARQ